MFNIHDKFHLLLVWDRLKILQASFDVKNKKFFTSLAQVEIDIPNSAKRKYVYYIAPVKFENILQVEFNNVINVGNIQLYTVV